MKICGIEMVIGDIYNIDGEEFELYQILVSPYKEQDETFKFKRMAITQEQIVTLTTKHIFDLCVSKKFLKGYRITYKQLFGYFDGLYYESGVYKQIEIKNLPTKVQFNEKKGATTVLYDDKVTVVKTTKGDKYDKTYGFLLAYFQHNSGLSKTQANKYIKKLVSEKNESVESDKEYEREKE